MLGFVLISSSVELHVPCFHSGFTPLLCLGICAWLLQELLLLEAHGDQQQHSHDLAAFLTHLLEVALNCSGCLFVSQHSAASPRSQQWRSWLKCLILAQVLPVHCSQQCPGHTQPQALSGCCRAAPWALAVARSPLLWEGFSCSSQPSLCLGVFWIQIFGRGICYRTTEGVGLEGTLKSSCSNPCHGQGHLPPDQVSVDLGLFSPFQVCQE